MKLQRIHLPHDREYYGGLALLLISCSSLAWALWRDAFRPAVFLAGFLLFSWGYLLLWRHDVREELKTLRAELEALRASLAPPAQDPAAWMQESSASPPAPLPDVDPQEAERPAGRPLEMPY